jgi:hypothetical protein
MKEREDMISREIRVARNAIGGTLLGVGIAAGVPGAALEAVTFNDQARAVVSSATGTELKKPTSKEAMAQGIAGGLLLTIGLAGIGGGIAVLKDKGEYEPELGKLKPKPLVGRESSRWFSKWRSRMR